MDRTEKVLKNMHSATYEQTKNHYQSLLSQHYTWLFSNGTNGGNLTLFKDILGSRISLENQCKIIIDLGCGDGAQTLPLLQLFGLEIEKMYCIDSSSYLLDELRAKIPKDLEDRVELLERDLLLFPSLVTSSNSADLIVCMGDTLTHLASLTEVYTLFKHSFDAIEASGGSLILQYRDLTKELFGGDRFIPVKSDERTVFTCFLEWASDKNEKDTDIPCLAEVDFSEDGSGRLIKVHDLVHVKKGIGAWELCTSWYQKLAISPAVCTALLESAGFKKIESSLGCDGMLIFKASV